MSKKFNKPNISITPPEMQFISEATIKEVESEAVGTTAATALNDTNNKTESIPEGYKLNPKYLEKRSKRVQLVMQPSLYDKIKAAADARNESFNEYCHRILSENI